MALTKKQRQKVWDKSNGHCWYCGCELPVKGWHADHIEAVRRYKTLEVVDDQVKTKIIHEKPHLDVLENIVPACRPCNLFKGVFSVEEFRNEISVQADRARSYSVNFRTAERFGAVEVTNKPIVFWFEKQNELI